MVSVQAAAGSIINQAMRGFLEDMTLDLSDRDPDGLLEEDWAASMFWDYTEMEWENGPFGKDIPETALYIKGGVMKRSAIPKPVFYSRGGLCVPVTAEKGWGARAHARSARRTCSACP